MVNRQVRQYYIDKENVDHSITDRLIQGGYKQLAGGYISNAKRAGVKDPSQYWHLIYSWSAQSEDEAPFNKSIKCGELIFWMAESSGAVSKDKLSELCDQILAGDVKEVIVRISYAVKRIKEGNRVLDSIPFSLNREKHPKLATMLFIAHSGAAAVNAGKVYFTKNPMTRI